MKYSYNWLKELSGTKKTPKQLAELLTMRAFELEDIRKAGSDTQLEFNILPNRGHDALSHVGIAREICAVEGRKLSKDFLRSDLRKILRSDLRMGIEIKDRKLCPRYIGAIIENVQVTASPKWLQQRLIVCGAKPINNIVDITNYVMLETGQPLHAFDAGKTTGNIIIRRSKKGEKIKLLDGKIYELNESNLVIADSEKALALAGIMGGFDSSVTKKTTSIILESANFNSTNIRKTRTSHNIVTESSYRFEREIDPNLAETATARAIELLQKYSGKNAKVIAISDVYPKKLKPWSVKLSSIYVNSLLGERIGIFQMKKILDNLGMKVKVSGKVLDCEIPTQRLDLKTQEDLVEEIGRIYGYENIPETAPRVELSVPRENIKRNFEHEIRDAMTALGFSEIYNYSFYSAKEIENFRFDVKNHVEVANPMNPDQQYMRWSLMPNLVKAVKTNLKNFENFSLFEVGRKFFYEKSKIPQEKTILASATVNPSAKGNLFFELKSKLETFLNHLGYKNTNYQLLTTSYYFWHPTRTARIMSHGKELGYIGEIDPIVLKKYNISCRVAAFGLKIDDLLALPRAEKIYHPISKYPVVGRDISMFVGKDTKYSDITETIKRSGGNLVKNIELFDVFEKEGEKSLALRLKIGSSAKTLTSAEIDAVMKKIISVLEKKLKVKVRK